MPLEHGKSKKAFVHNLKAEEHAGKPMKQSLAIAYSMKRRSDKAKKKFAEGGMVDMEGNPPHYTEEMKDSDDMHGMDMPEYSEGGMVANGGDDDMDNLADGKPNEFDDLALDDHLEFNYTGANSGDELDDAREIHDRMSEAKRILRSRALKDKLPRPA